MYVIYKLPVKPSSNIPVSENMKSLSLDGANINWEKDSNGYLTKITIIFSGLPIKQDTKGFILDTYPELTDLAYRLALFLANYVLVSVGIDIVEVDHILWRSPEILSETQEEHDIYKSSKERFNNGLKISFRVVKELQYKEHLTIYKHAKAFAHYAEGLRMISPLLKFEQFWKVIEYFFEKNKQVKDSDVSEYVISYDPTYDCEKVKTFREMRHRLVHPLAKNGHLNSQDLSAVKTVEKEVNSLQKLAKILLDHPPK